MRVVVHLAAVWTVLAAVADPSVISIPGLGDVQGSLNALAREFRGIPYAAPVQRWQPPAPVQPWAPAVLDARTDGAGCMQACHEPPLGCPAVISEDCLFMNIFTPLPVPTAPLPVSVFLHGGNFRDGFGGGPLYNGTNLAAGAFSGAASPQQSIVVSINYRLGVFGFLYTGTNATDAAGITGNYGLADQRAALLWVQQHISAFGGDPTRVLLWGQSAGAMSVASHLVSPGSVGLFQRALAVSEPFALPFRNTTSAMSAAAQVAWYAQCPQSLGPETTQCLRSLPAEVLLKAQVAASTNTSDDKVTLMQLFMPFTPTTGTRANDTAFDLPNWPLFSFQGRSGAAPVHDVALMLGTTSSEGTLFIDDAIPGNATELEYFAALAFILGIDEPAVWNQYPPPQPLPPGYDFVPLLSNATTAGVFRCATRNATRELVSIAERVSPVFLYEYSHLLR